MLYGKRMEACSGGFAGLTTLATSNFRRLRVSLTPSPPGTTVPTEIVSGGFCAVLPYYPLLSMVPDGRMAITRGSSGVGKYRLLEVVIKGGRAVDVLKFKVGDRVLQS